MVFYVKIFIVKRVDFRILRGMMNSVAVVDILQAAIIVMLKLSVPLMLVGLVVGVAISLVQALTQIQEMTLTFVPKMILVLITMILLMPFMVGTLEAFTQQLYSKIVHGF
jgi:flagellar biosynthetic protein FliQ